MRTAALFAGIGGLELGLSRAGHETFLFSELWEPASAVLSARFPEVPNVGDVAGLSSLPGGIELLTAGFPCQDLSQAGKTAGIGGARSGLVDHVFRLLDGRRVPWVLLENVSFMLHLDAGRGMTRLVQAFEERGYRWAYRVINSLAFLPQRRERVFFLASLDGDPRDVLLVDEAEPQMPQTSLATHAHGFYWTEGVRGLGWAPNAVPTIKNGSTVGIPAPPAILFPGGLIAKPALEDAERLQGFEAGWTDAAAGAGRRSWRWSLVGNAVTVPVSEWVGQRLAHPLRYDNSRDRGGLRHDRWPRAAYSDRMVRREVAISSFPVWRERPSLSNFLEFAPEPLSVRATAGFLSRISNSRLRFVDGFKESVAQHLARMRGGQQPLPLQAMD